MTASSGAPPRAAVHVTIRGLERFAFIALLSSLVLMALDWVSHPRWRFFLVPFRRHGHTWWRPVWLLLRTRPGLTLGAVLLAVGLAAALIAVTADAGRTLMDARHGEDPELGSGQP